MLLCNIRVVVSSADGNTAIAKPPSHTEGVALGMKRVLLNGVKTFE
ncbi:MAG: hypothetical protein JNL70_23470 [Saprospiraceae bacterium]|nr:hypothetical protein [Saprospiraceae bacterium]